MKPSKILMALIFPVILVSCSKEEKNPGQPGETVTNSRDLVTPGQPNCTEAISGNVRVKLVSDSGATVPLNLKVRAKTEKLYPSGGFILVYNLTRTGNNIYIDFQQVHTACGGAGAAAFLPATAQVNLNGLAAGSYPVQIKVAGQVNNGTLVVPQSAQAPYLQMQTTNGLVIE